MPFACRVRSLLGRLLTLAILASALMLIAGFFGASVHAFDSLGHFRAHLAVLAGVLAVVALLARRWVPAGLGLAAAALGLGTTLPMLVAASDAIPPGDSRPAYTLLQMNLRFNAKDKAEAIRRIADARPDIVTVQEVTPEWRAVFDTLGETYPFQAYCQGEENAGEGILSRRPFVDGPDLCRPDDGLLVRSIDLNGRAVTVASLHLEWPWPSVHWEQIERMQAILPTLPQPSLLAGDFNAAPWSAAVAAVARAGGWRIQRGIGPSWMNGEWPAISAAWFGLPIDNLLVSPEIAFTSVETLAPTASDHLPVLARFSLPQAAPQPSVGVANWGPGAAPQG